MRRYSRWLAAYLLVLACLSLYHYGELIWRSGPLWSPIDELAHYDYIDQLGSGRLPHPRDSISDYSERITAEYFGFPEGIEYDGTKESLGITGKSYEAHQPPVYYALLAGPNRLLKAFGVPPPVQIRILRSFNMLFLVGAAILALLVARDLAVIAGLDPLLGYFVCYLVLSVRFIHRYYVSSDQLSPLVGAGCVYLAVRLWRTGKESYAGWSCLAAVLAFLTKYTNGLLLLFWGLNTLFFYQRTGRSRPRLRVWHWAPLALPILYFAGNAYLYGWGDLLKSKTTAEYFAGFLTPTLDPVGITWDLMNRSLDLRPVLTWAPRYAAMFLGLIVLNYALSFRRVFLLEDRRALPILIACQMAGLIVLAAFLLNPYVPGVQWYFFRYYEGYVLFWYAALAATPFLVDVRWLRVAGLVGGTATATWITYLWL